MGQGIALFSRLTNHQGTGRVCLQELAVQGQAGDQTDGLPCRAEAKGHPRHQRVACVIDGGKGGKAGMRHELFRQAAGLIIGWADWVSHRIGSLTREISAPGECAWAVASEPLPQRNSEAKTLLCRVAVFNPYDHFAVFQVFLKGEIEALQLDPHSRDEAVGEIAVAAECCLYLQQWRDALWPPPPQSTVKLPQWICIAAALFVGQIHSAPKRARPRFKIMPGGESEPIHVVPVWFRIACSQGDFSSYSEFAWVLAKGKADKNKCVPELKIDLVQIDAEVEQGRNCEITIVTKLSLKFIADLSKGQAGRGKPLANRPLPSACPGHFRQAKEAQGQSETAR